MGRKNGSMKKPGKILSFVMVFALALTLTAVAGPLKASAAFAGGDGTAANPYQIATVADLRDLSQFLIATGDSPDNSARFVLTADIDVTGQNLPMLDYAETSTGFYGTLDGQNHTITGLSSPLFCDNYGTIENLILKNANVTNPICTFDYGYGNVETGPVAAVGALVTENDGPDADYGNPAGQIINCHSINGTVAGFGDVGGLVGLNNCGIIEKCSATGSVTVRSDASDPGIALPYGAGGLVGTNDGHNNDDGTSSVAAVSNCYSISTIHVISNTVQLDSDGNQFGSHSFGIGGLVGENGLLGPTDINHCYASSTVTVENNSGASYEIEISGLVVNDGMVNTTIENNYYNINYDQTAAAFDVGSQDGCTPLNAAQMKVQGSFKGFDFTNIWKIDASGVINSGMPYLNAAASVTPPPSPAPSPITASPTSSGVLVNGTPVTFDAYNIGGNNYFKLRDLAYVLSGTEKQFEISYDNAKNAISLTSGQPYTPIGGEMTGKGAGNQDAVSTTSTIYLDGTQTIFTAYNIGGNNYFKLRDVAQAFDFGVSWDGTTNTITIDTSTGYTSD